MSRRQLCICMDTPDSETWSSVVQQIEEQLKYIDQDGHLGRITMNDSSSDDDDQDNYTGRQYVHANLFPWYAPPVQRQRWGENQVLPHINFNELFFDLFYVAASFNLGVMLMSSMNPYDWQRGIIYFIGIFGPFYLTWEAEVQYASQYTVIDYSHRIFCLVRFMFVAFAVLHIKPLNLLADPKSVETLSFTLAIFFESIMHMALNFELCWLGQGDRESIQNHTMRKIKHQLLPTSLMYFVAVIVAGVMYFQPAGHHDDAASRRLDGGGGGGETSNLNGEDDYYKYVDDYEQVPKSTPAWLMSDLSLTLTAIAYIVNIFCTALRKLHVTSGCYGDIKKHFVPNNVDYLIHRYGEWIILMIGESVLSLLIVETTESRDYYLIATLGCVSIFFLQALKFESEPSHADGHALYRNFRNATCFSLLIQVLSMALISFGVSYKIFLSTIVNEDDSSYGGGHGRMLATSFSISPEISTAVFCLSLALVLFSLELMTLTHRGVMKSYTCLFKGDMGEWKVNWPLAVITLCKGGLILFTATIPLWNNDITAVTVCGFFVIVAIAFTRIVGWGWVNHERAVKKFMTVNFVGNLKKILANVVDKIQHAACRIISKFKKSFGHHDISQPAVSCKDQQKRLVVEAAMPTKVNTGSNYHDADRSYHEMSDVVLVTDPSGFALKVPILC